MEFSSQPWEASRTALGGRLRMGLALAALTLAAAAPLSAWAQAADDAKSTPAAATAPADNPADSKTSDGKESPAPAVKPDETKRGAQTPGPRSEPVPLGRDVIKQAKGVTAAGVIKVLVVLAIFIIPTLIGYRLAKALRMPDYGWKFSLAIGSLAAAAIVVATGEVKLGPDLSGGITLIYELADDSEMAAKPGDANAPAGAAAAQRGVVERTETMSKLIGALQKRVDPSGTREVTIRKYGEGQVEIIIPHAEKQDLEEIERKISTAGALEFRITANEQFERDKNFIDLAQRLPPGENVARIEGGVPVARWVEYDAAEFGTPEQARSRGLVIRETGKTPQALVMVGDGLDVTGKYLRSTMADIDETGRPQVSFTFNTQGAQLFGRLTGGHLPNPSGERYSLGILLDNRLLQAPTIESKITDRGRISGGSMTQKDVDFIVDILNAGSLPAALNKEPISRAEISPTLGKETVRKGKLAIVWSVAVVAVFMIFYYKFAGVVAVAALAANLLLILGIMVLIKGAFTLPGLAGLALTIGMSVDANVLINERIREELEKGAALRMAIRNGYARAFTTIIDANVANLITAAAIYKIAPDSVKGFGVTLIIGILMSVYAAVFLTRLVFDVAERRGWIKTLSMRHLIKNTHIDFVGWQHVAIGSSLLLIALGLVGVAMRGNDLWDIDFVGGSSVTFVLDQDQKMEFPQVLDELNATPLAEQNMSLVEMGNSHTEYTVTTSNPDTDEVQKVLREKFGDRLKTYHVEVGQLEPIAFAAAPAPGLLSALPASRTLSPIGLPVWPIAVLQADSASPPADDSADSKAADSTAAEQGDSKDAEEASSPAAADAPKADESTGTAPEAKSTATYDPFSGGTSAVLNFSVDDEANDAGGVNYAAITTMLQTALAANKHEDVAVEVSNPDYQQGSARSFREWTVKLALPEAEASKVLGDLNARINNQPVFPLSNKIGARVAGRMAGEALLAIVISCCGIGAYLWFRFHSAIHGLATVTALVHDVLIALGAVAVSAFFVAAVPALASGLMVHKFQVGLTMVAAFLTLIGYSLNDTIVVFDRIREIKGKSPELTPKMVNDSVNQTLSRTLLTSLTTFMTTTVLYIAGGAGIHGFAFAMLIGIIVGTYSSICIANPLLLYLSRRMYKSNATGGKSQAA